MSILVRPFTTRKMFSRISQHRPKQSNKDETSTTSVISRLDALVRGTNYQFIQSNGQRIYCPLSQSRIVKPPRGTEIFIGNLPQDIYEDELIPLFGQIGPIYNVRMMLDFSGNSRGYAFIAYHRTESAFKAVSYFNHFQIRSQSRLAVSISIDNRRLFIGRIPKNQSIHEVKEILYGCMDGAIKVDVYEDLCDPEMNRGFAFVEFESHRSAALARKKFAPGNFQMFDIAVFVDWAQPLPIIDPEVLDQVSILYLSNLPCGLKTGELTVKLRIILNDIVRFVTKVHKNTNYAFVHFHERQHAEIARAKLIGLQIWDQDIEVQWARPVQLNPMPINIKSLPRGKRANR